MGDYAKLHSFTDFLPSVWTLNSQLGRSCVGAASRTSLEHAGHPSPQDFALDSNKHNCCWLMTQVTQGRSHGPIFRNLSVSENVAFLIRLPLARLVKWKINKPTLAEQFYLFLFFLHFSLSFSLPSFSRVQVVVQATTVVSCFRSLVSSSTSMEQSLLTTISPSQFLVKNNQNLHLLHPKSSWLIL